MTDVFKNILDDDEVVIKQFKPNKFRFFFGTYGAFLLIMLFLGAFIVLPLALDGEVFIGFVFIGIVIGVFVVTLLLTTLFAVLSYQKKYYAYTNKRILIQGGVIGIDYKGLDHKMIGAIEVRVDLLDKIVRKNTGTIKFGSQASPLSKQAAPMFIFHGIHDPYNVYREIKKYIDSVKQ